jgi:hypothetical protein
MVRRGLNVVFFSALKYIPLQKNFLHNLVKAAGNRDPKILKFRVGRIRLNVHSPYVNVFKLGTGIWSDIRFRLRSERIN